MFYEYDQNNSGGSFIVNDDVTYNVIIEADSAKQADAKAEDIGIYFDDDYDVDCECCGTRWSRTYSDGSEEPEIYGKPVVDYEEYWAKDNEPWAHVYYKDGTKRSFTRSQA
jgi:hypothetical protein